MKTRFTLLMTVLLLLVAAPIVVYAIDFPHNSDNGYTCDVCHNSHGVLGTTGFNNACVYCHSPGDPKAGTKPFTEADAANPYNSVINGYSGTKPAKLYQTSHNWIGSDVNAQAGAVAPVNPKLTNFNTKNKLLCVRCHNVHGAYSSAGNSSKFLRIRNESDQMCVDCHRPRNTSDQAVGTHPVNIVYADKVAANPAKFNGSTPLNTNPNNATSALKLDPSGKIQCTTCHGVHYSDGKSGTQHTAANFSNLSANPRGNILRTNTFGQTATDQNICKNCHNHKNHVADKVNIQCNDCHSGHTEYISDADKAAGDTAVNKYMLRRYVNYSSDASGKNTVRLSTYRKRMVYKNSTSYANAQNTGACQTCHKLPGTVDQHKDPNYLNSTNGKSCQECHSHNAPTNVTAACGSCHGTPPQHTVAGNIMYGTTPSGGYAVYSTGKSYVNFNGGAGIIYKNESTAGHPTHGAGKPYSYACDECHKGNTHKNQTYQNVFIDKTGIVAGSSAAFVATNATTSTCSNMYCHSYGLSTLTSAKSVTWAAGVRGSITNSANRCIACHNGVKTTATFNNLSTNSHFRHVSLYLTQGKSYGCTACHNSVVSDNLTIANYSLHANGTKDVSPNTTLMNGKLTTMGWNGTTCANYCHTDGKGGTPLVAANWSNRNSGKCDTCHATATSAPQLATGAHTVHFTVVGSTAPATVCTKCHTYAGTVPELGSTHVDGTVQVTTGCTANGCHANITAPAWSASTNNNTCTKCHGTPTVTVTEATKYLMAPADATATDTGKVSADTKIGAHQTHLRYLNGFSNYSTVDYRCQACHGTLPTTSTHATGSSTPQGSFKALANKWGAMSPTYSGTTCSNVYCHNPAAYGVLAQAGTNSSPSWNDATYITDAGKSLANCEKCHLVPGSAGFSKQGAHTGSYATTDSSANQCNSCHGHNGDMTGTLGLRHIDGIRGVSGGSTCDGCHDYDTVGATWTGTKWTGGSWGKLNLGAYATGNQGWGAHAKHINYIKTRLNISVALTAAGSFGSGQAAQVCGSCHTNTGTHNMSATDGSDPTGRSINFGDATFKIGGAAGTSFLFGTSFPAQNPVYNGVSGTSSGTTAKTCSNISCHYFTTPLWSTY